MIKRDDKNERKKKNRHGNRRQKREVRVGIRKERGEERKTIGLNYK